MGLTLLRHTQPDVAPATCYGRTDVDVAATFIADADAALSLTGAPRHIVSSPLQRCTKLAARAAAQYDLPYCTDPDLVEMDFGQWEGLLWQEVPRIELDQWADNFMHARPHGGESVAMVFSRAKRALARHRKNAGDSLLITHGGFIKAALAQRPTQDAFQTNIGFGSCISIMQRG